MYMGRQTDRVSCHVDVSHYLVSFGDSVAVLISVFERRLANTEIMGPRLARPLYGHLHADLVLVLLAVKSISVSHFEEPQRQNQQPNDEQQLAKRSSSSKESSPLLFHSLADEEDGERWRLG